ncbi:DUF120 domain-containing protein [Methanonatronarchaeum sp. AMET-Sl]|uniref:DUF120 domain-containing protein n=1 Tax=Methanonatronarchaeum sp. AMET-Sl TaxID=3037654 RepID=UPI00244DEAEA|nr:DUF120 domain-containing protein [Methanonatronarchaeum sp. AMET-Sl]WGI17796.1 DUF120 domain-containing protein [Methanonatronarchaeum sp. AMET-Sl]
MINPDSLYVLKQIALKNNNKRTTNAELAEKLNTSPQTISRRLKKLEKNSYITRDVKPNGQTINISKKGYNLLKKELKEYKNIFDNEQNITLKGHVIDGIGEGQYYISQPEYQKQFQKKLGFKAYPGTLNIKLKPDSQKKYKEIKKHNAIDIKGFQKGDRTFGNAKCFQSKINGKKCALIQPDRSHYSNEIIEIIAPKRLRNKIDTKKVKIEVQI